MLIILVIVAVGGLVYLKTSTKQAPYVSGAVETIVPESWPEDEIRTRGNEALLFSNGTKIDAYKETLKRYPETLEEILANGVIINKDVFSSELPRYILAENKLSFELRFTGEDTVYDTPDDVLYDRNRLADNLKPMYGGDRAVKIAAQLLADKHFIDSIVAESGTREKGATRLVLGAQQFLDAGDLDLAMMRFNQAWLLDLDNPDVYIGFSVILDKQGKPSEALAMRALADEKRALQN